MILQQKYSVGNTRVDVMSLNPDNTFDKLPTNIYSVRKDMMGFYLEILKPRFNMPPKLYGKTELRTAKIMNTYNSRSVSTGVLMTGDKGSGKTILSESICNASLDQGIPVIMVTEPHVGEAFNTFINSLGEIVLFFDEFGKTYSASNDDYYEDDNQSSLLTLFDGAHSKKRLILVTENKEHKIDEFMKNRPGRLYYHFRFNKLENDVIEEYSVDNLPNNSEDFIAEITKFASRVNEFSFDVLKAIIEERNRYNEDLLDIISDLNISRGYDDRSMIQIISVTNSAGINIELSEESILIPEPTGETCIYFKEKDEVGHRSYIYASKQKLKASKDNKFIYSIDGYTVIAEKVIEEFNLNKYDHLF